MGWRVLRGSLGPEGGCGSRGYSLSVMRSHWPFVGRECSPFLSSLHLREDPPGFEAKDDYPMSKEELLSQVVKSVRRGACRGGGRTSAPLWDPDTLPRQLEVREQNLKELTEVIRKADSARSTSLPRTRRASSASPLATTRSPSNVPGSILSHKTNGILVSSGGRATSSNVGHVTFGDPSSSADHVTFGPPSTNEGLMSGQSSTAGRVTFEPLSSSSYLGSTGYVGSSKGQESFGGVEHRVPGSESSGGPESSRGQVSSSGAASSTGLDSTTSKDSRNDD